MKLPHITVEYRDEEPQALGKISGWLVVGFGIHWAWVYAAMYNGSLLFGSTDAPGADVAFGVSLTVFVIVLLCYGIFLEPMRKLFDTPHQRKRNRLVAAIALVLGMVLLPLAGTASPLHLACCAASGIFTGTGSAVLLMSYGVSFSVCDISAATVCTALSMLVCAALYLLIIAADSIAHPAGAALCFIAPFAEFACLNRCSAELVDRLSFNDLTIPVKTAPFALHVCVPSLVFGVILGLTRTHVMLPLRTESELEAVGLPFFLGAVFTCVIMVLAMLTQRHSHNYLFRTLVPVVAVLISSLFALDAQGSAYETFALAASYFMLEACLWVMYSDIAQRFRVSAFTSYGFGRGTLALGTLLGYAFSLPGGAFIIRIDSIESLVIVAFVALTLGVALLPTGSEMRRTLKRGSYCLALGDEDERELGLDDASEMAEADDSGKGQHAAAGGGDGEGAGVGAGEDEGRSADGAPAVVDAQAGDAPAMHAPRDGAEADGSAADGQKADATEVAGADGDAGTARTVDAASAENAGAPAPLPATKPAAAAPGHAGQQQKRGVGWFKRKCSAVAETYLLSRRETEVLFMLAKGKNSAAIQEALYISPGTANTHMRHIYRKLDVHSQQELMRLVDSFEIE